LAITWIGHSTVLLDFGDLQLITDPLLTRRVAHLVRRRELPLRGMDDVDVVLLSHVHMDHLHIRSLKWMPAGTRMICPDGAEVLLRSAGIHHVRSVKPGDTIVEPPLSIRVTHADHKPGRGPHSRVRAQPVGYVIEAYGYRVYFAGDTDLFDGMADLGSIDVALLPIWGWGPTAGRGHLDPWSAAEATRVIEPRTVVPIHWGTYTPENGRRRLPDWFERPVEEFQTALEQAGQADRLHVLAPGETVRLDG
jgi:L-ascorbate metabolism protein UlaG (beta-lactamase superfamily)